MMCHTRGSCCISLVLLIVSLTLGSASIDLMDRVANLFAAEMCLNHLARIYKFAEPGSFVETKQPSTARDQLSTAADKIKALTQHYGDLQQMLANPATREAGRRIFDTVWNYTKETEGELQDVASQNHVWEAEVRASMGENFLELRGRYLDDGRNVTQELKEVVVNCVAVLQADKWLPENFDGLSKLNLPKLNDYHEQLISGVKITPILQLITLLEAKEWKKWNPQKLLTFDNDENVGDEAHDLSDTQPFHLDDTALEEYHELLQAGTKRMTELSNLEEVEQADKGLTNIHGEYQDVIENIENRVPTYIRQHKLTLARVFPVINSRLDKLGPKITNFVVHLQKNMEELAQQERKLAEDTASLVKGFKKLQLVKKKTENEYAKYYAYAAFPDQETKGGFRRERQEL